jgi:hypothetical protein
VDPLCTLSDAIPAPVRTAPVQESTIYPVVMSLSLFWKGMESFTKKIVHNTSVSFEICMLSFVSKFIFCVIFVVNIFSVVFIISVCQHGLVIELMYRLRLTFNQILQTIETLKRHT